MRLVFLGLDGTGKTTLASHIAARLRITYYKDHEYKEKFFGNPSYTLFSAISLMQLFEANPELPVIFDRWFWDELVYGAVLNRGLDHAPFWELDQRAAKQKFILIYLQKKIRPADDLIGREHGKDLIAAYEDLLSKTSCKVIRLNTDTEDTVNQFFQIVKQLQA